MHKKWFSALIATSAIVLSIISNSLEDNTREIFMEKAILWMLFAIYILIKERLNDKF